MSLLLMLIGLLMALYGTIMIVVRAFQEHILWGLGALFVPLVALVFAVLNWDRCKGYLGWALVGWLIAVVGAYMGQP